MGSKGDTSIVQVVGAGTMGAGIAQVACSAGWHVYLVDVDVDRAEQSVAGVRKRLDRLVEKGRLTSSERDAASSRLEAAASVDASTPVDLAIEAIVENLDVKTTVFRALMERLPADCLLASNTSSLSISAMAKALPNPERLVGMHFFNPVPLMPLVEVISTEWTPSDAIDRAAQIATSWGKTVVRCIDTPGFIVNRVARGYYLEAMRMLGEGVASVEEIDAAMTRLAGFRMGPFSLMDLVGIDVNYTVSCSVYEQKGEPARLKPHEIQAGLFERKELGRKTGQGFYRYDGKTPQVSDGLVASANQKEFSPASDLMDVVDRFCQKAGTDGTDSPVDRYIVARILVTIFNEAGLALDERVATAADIDTAMKLGTNYPRGPVEWSEAVGRNLVQELLMALNGNVQDARFAPANYWSGPA